MRHRHLTQALILLIALIALPLIGHAQATRTWVSGVGDDANPCSRTAPCRTFAGAISKTAANGIINLLDPAAVGAVTVTKAITLQADGNFAGVLPGATNGIIINAGVGDTVVLRGLAINGSGGISGITGLNGVRILQAGAVRIENCDIQSFGESAIEVANTSALKLSVQDTVIENTIAGGAVNANDAGIALVPGAGGSVRAHFDRVRLHGLNQFGINAVGDVRVVLRDSVISGVTGSALQLDGSSGSAQVLVDNSSLVENSVNGIFATGAGAAVRLHRSVVSGNAQGLLTASGGQIISYGSNVIAGNVANGSPTSTVSQQ